MEKQTNVDVSQIPQYTIERLENILEKCNNQHIKIRFYNEIGNEKKATKYGKEIIKQDKRNEDSSSLNLKLQNADHYNLTAKERKDIAKKLVNQFTKGKNYAEAIEIAEKYLNLPQKKMNKLREDRLFSILVGDECKGIFFEAPNTSYEDFPPLDVDSFLDYVKNACKNINEKDVKTVAEKAYHHIMNYQNDHSNVNLIYFLNGDCLQAGIIAKEFDLGQEKIEAAGQKLADWAHNGQVGFNYQNVCETTIEELDLSTEIKQRMMLPFFDVSIKLRDDQRLKQKYELKDEDIKPIVQKEYSDNISQGHFDGALYLMSNYQTLIKNNEVDIEDLKLLVDILQ